MKYLILPLLGIAIWATGLALGSWCGRLAARANCLQEQIEAGRAYWWCDPQTGIMELKWKEVCP